MGWGHGIIDGREVGYSVDAVCDEPDCAEEIDRGLYYRCGSHDFDAGCGGYFCGSHLFFDVENARDGNYCGRCIDGEREGRA